MVQLNGAVRLTLMVTPEGRGSFSEQTREALARLRTALSRQPMPIRVTVQTVFLGDAGDQLSCEALLAEHYGAERPITTFVHQPPCGGAALAIEAWAIGGDDVKLEWFGAHALAVSHNDVRWVYVSGIVPPDSDGSVYSGTTEVLLRARSLLAQAGVSFENVARTWFYLGDITGPESDTQRYKELNRARTDFYRGLRFGGGLLRPAKPHSGYPASTGIGMAGRGLAMSCLAVATQREDVKLTPLENPCQTPAYAYHLKHSPCSPKFSRAMALVMGENVTTWISGTASIVDSESLHPGDVEKQTHQTIDNIERLIGPQNLAAHGLKHAGATLRDLAKVRVYVKRLEDYPRCKAVCEQRFGSVPVIYALANVCRPELLVEIEGVAFTKQR
jgi:enamine deaminase RidA (YjgF/YER057c/UK114 family)